MDSSKKPWQSKTLWVSALTALLPIVCPPAAVWVAANPSLAMAGLGAVFAALRVVTKGSVSIS